MFVVVTGAGVIGREVINLLVKNKHDVVVIDIDPEACERIYAETGATTVQGSATDLTALKEAGVTKADVVVCLMEKDADNIACALLSKSLGVPKIIARMRNPVYAKAYELAGINSIVRVAELLLNQIVMEIEQPKARKIVSLGGGKAVIYAIRIPSGAKVVGMTIREITTKEKFPKECTFVGIYYEEGEKFLIPRGNHVLNESDTVFVVSTMKHIVRATEFLTELE